MADIYVEPKELEGLVIDTMDVDDSDGSDNRILITTKCGRSFEFVHHQDCCEYVRIEDGIGNPKALEGYKLVKCEMLAKEVQSPDSSYSESATRTTITFETTAATLISRWIGTSNGYYSEAVNLVELGAKDVSDDSIETPAL